jgi:hypothetical protein
MRIKIDNPFAYNSCAAMLGLGLRARLPASTGRGNLIFEPSGIHCDRQICY